MQELEQLDKEKLQIYYSNFIISKETISRHSHKLEFWHSTIKKCTSQKLLHSQSQFMFDSMELESKFTRENLRPLCFNSVLGRWKEEKTIVSENEFLSSGTLQTLKGVANWILGFFSHEESEVEREEFIFMPLLEESIQKYYSKLPMDVLAEHEIMEQFPDLTEKDLEILLEFWRKKGILNVKSEKNFRILKKSNIKGDINIVDEGIVRVKRTLCSLRQAIKELETRIQLIKEEIKINLGERKKEKALDSLKRLKAQEVMMEKRVKNYDNLQGILEKINQVSMDKSVIEAMEVGSVSLEKALKDSGLTSEYIQDVFLKVEEVTASLEEIQDVSLSFAQTDEDMQDIEKELDELMLQESVKDSGQSEVGVTEVEVQARILDLAPSTSGLSPLEPSSVGDSVTRKALILE